MEIEKYFNKNDISKRMFVGLLQAPGKWRETFKNERELLYFNKLNEQIYIELFANGIYDNDARYSCGMDRLIRFFGGTYLPWHQIPEEQDLLDELANIDSSYKISDEERNSILSDFRVIRERDLQGAPTIDMRIKLWIQDCEFMGLNLIFPYLYLGIRFLNQQNYKEAMSLFKKIIASHENEPRGYRGLGQCLGNLGDYESAKACYDKAVDVTKKVRGRHQYFLSEILHNRARVQMEIGNYLAAKEDLEEALSLARKNEFSLLTIMLDLEFCHKQMGDSIGKRISLLEEAMKINCLEEDIYDRMGNCYLEKFNWEQAKVNFLKAYELVSSSRNAFALCLCYANLKNRKAMDDIFKRINVHSLSTEEDVYYYGFLLYILGNDEEAKRYYKKCTSSLWQWYGDSE